MTGQQMYTMYRQAMANEGFDLPEWAAQGDAEMNAWDELAAAVDRGDQEIDEVEGS